MDDMIQSDSQMAANSPIELFTTNTGSKYKVRALSIDAADEWMEKAAAVEPLQRKVQSQDKKARESESDEDLTALRAARRAYNQAVYDCVFAYDEKSLPREKITQEGVSPAQMARAFLILQQVNDPFVTGTILQTNLMREIVRGLPVGNGATPALSRR